jgi:hypothetical protein
MSVEFMNVDKMSVDKMSVDEMSLDEMPCCRKFDTTRILCKNLIKIHDFPSQII